MTPQTLPVRSAKPAWLIAKVTLIAFVLVAVAAGLTGSAVSATSCRTTWGSLSKSAAPVATDGHATAVRTGRHTCFDRLVVDIDGDPGGYRIEYVSSLEADGSGKNVPVKGGAIIRIIADVPAYDDAGSATVDPAVVSATNVNGYRTFRDVEWAGSFEGRTTLGLGVRARLPFRVLVLDGPGTGSRLVIDVAHRW